MEVIVTLFTLVVGVGPMVTLCVASRGLDQQARCQAAAYAVARQEMDALRASPFADRGLLPHASFTVPAGVTAQFPTAAFTGDYSLLTYGPAGQTPGEQQIAVRVRWLSATSPGGTSSVELDTLSAQGGGR